MKPDRARPDFAVIRRVARAMDSGSGEDTSCLARAQADLVVYDEPTMRAIVAKALGRAHIGPDRDVREAASIMLDHKIGALPVRESGRLIGIVTETDLLRALVRAVTHPIG